MSSSKRLLDSDSDSSGSGSGSGSDIEKGFASLAKSKKTKGAKKAKHDSYSDSASGSDSDWGSKKKSGKQQSSKKKPGKGKHDYTDSEEYDDDDGARRKTTASDSVDTRPKVPEDVEEGEVSSSDSDASSVFDDGYDENYYGDEEDKKRLDAMTEREREELIYNRQVAREEKRGRWEIEKKLRRDRRLNEKKKQKREDRGNTDATSEAASDTVFNKLDLKERSKERKKTQESKVDKKSTALDQLKARREDRKARAEEKEKARVEEEQKRGDNDDVSIRHKDDASSTVSGKGKTQGRLKAEDVYSDDSDGSDSDDSKPAVRQRKKSDSESKSSDSEDERDRKPQYIEKVEDLNRIRLSRTKAERWIHHPFFPKVARGCFVRIGIGVNSGVSLYRVGEIVDIRSNESSRVYSLGLTKTDKLVRIRHGGDEKSFRLEFISNQDFTADEFERWANTCRKKDIVLPTLDEVRKKEKELKEANNYQLKDEDVDFIINEKSRFKEGPVNYAMQKAQLMKDREMAMGNGNQDLAEQLRKDIDDLEERAKALDKRRTESISSIFYINERNRRRNIEEAEKAILEEVKANKGNKVDDPFTRRNTKPSRPSVKGQGAKDGNSEPSQHTLVDSDVDLFAVPEPVGSPAKSFDDDLPPLPKAEDLLDSKASKKHVIKSTADLFSAHDFDLKIDLDAKMPSSEPVMSRPIMPTIREPAPIKRSLNLEAYKKKRGLM